MLFFSCLHRSSILSILAAELSKCVSMAQNFCSVSLLGEEMEVEGARLVDDWLWQTDDLDVDKVLGVACEKDGDRARFWGAHHLLKCN